VFFYLYLTIYIWQISEGLGFLHTSARMLHRNIAPESILINQHGAWKIAGFEYCLGKGFL
jgi:SCY1-like protein 2